MQSNRYIKVIIAEDSKPNRELLESYLSLFPQIQIISSVSNGDEAINQFENQEITAIFLDIEMPNLNGLSAAAKIREIQPNIFIVFVTAHTGYAAEAFQLEATDYLVKPISKESVERAVKRIEKYLGKNIFQNSKTLEDILLIKNKSETYLIRPDTIIYIEKEVRKTIIHTENGTYPTSETLISLEKTLNKNFFRCHKSFIINIGKIEKIVPIAERIYKVNFYNYPLGTTMGRSKFEELYEIIKNNVVGGVNVDSTGIK